MQKTVSVSLPHIFEYLDPLLLSKPCPKFGEDCETLWRVYQYILRKLKPKARGNLAWLENIEKLEKEFLEIYERAKTKENELKKTHGKSFPPPGLYFEGSHRRVPRIYQKIRYSR